MVKSEIIAKLSERIHRKLTKSDLEKILKIIINTIIKEAKNQKGTEIRKFGRFSHKVIKEKLNARNPLTGESIRVKSRISIAFNTLPCIP